ncbi:MAG: response regulator transcription factor [Planctomycetes bacterium]|nr:response regulator transcription factor [Planctomycetota bacterium]
MSEPARKLRVVFADDEPLGRATVRTLLERDPGVEVVAECKNGVEAVAAVRRERPDILILDIEMPGLSGLEVVEELEDDEPPVVVFATAYDHYAVHAFDVHAVDYLLKPFDDERFATALGRAKERASRENGATLRERLSDLLETLTERQAATARREPATTRLSIHREGRVDLIDTADLVWVEAQDQYVMLHTRRGDFLMRESMGKLEQTLDPARFLRTHRSAIVALDQVRTLERQSGGVGRVQLANGLWLPVSRSRMSTVRAHLG